MTQIINTNVASLNAQRNLNVSQSSLSTSLQRLSSGLRINSARDDAAGLAISERFTAQIRGLTQASRNANDGISLAQTAEGALAETGNNLQRIRELAVQSANATNSSTDRAALQAETAQLIAEIDRVATTTKFNGVALLDGTFTNQAFQVGADANQTINVASIASSRTSALGSSISATFTGAAVSAVAFASGDLTLNGVGIGASSAGGAAGQTAASGYAKAIAINAASGTGVTATANATSIAGVAASAFTAITAGDLTINGVSVGAVAAGGAAVAQGANIATAVNSVSATTGVTASANGTTGAVTLTATDGRDITIAHAGASSSLAITGLTAATTGSTLTVTSSASIVVAGSAPAKAGLSATTYAAAATGVAVSVVDISTVSGANSAITSIDAALATINSTRATLGAVQNRFSSVVASLATTTENLSASRSRIRDADFAAETASLTRNNVLQQAGIAILAQANSQPQQVLALLR